MFKLSYALRKRVDTISIMLHLDCAVVLQDSLLTVTTFVGKSYSHLLIMYLLQDRLSLARLPCRQQFS